MTEPPRRAVSREIDIAAPVDAVWRALTDAEELTRWFPPVARVETGVGGKLIRLWQTGNEVEERIERWEPNVHLRTLGLTGGWAGIVTDYYLESRAGRTVLRVVSSGFGTGADWDDLYDGFSGGWDFELRGLQHYLEHHAGVPRLVVLARAPRAVPARESWDRLLGPHGFLGSRGVADAELGARYTAQLASGRRLSGVVALQQPPRQFVATVEELNDALLRIETRCAGDSGTPWVWLSTYGISAAHVHDIEQEWQALVDAAFESASPSRISTSTSSPSSR